MRRSAQRMAACGLAASLSLALMGLGSTFGVLTYVCPMLAGVLMMCVREEYGTRWALTLWAAVGLLAVILVPEPEMTALFVGIFGWYPAARPALDRLPGCLAPVCRLLVLNGALALVYGTLRLALGLEEEGGALYWACLLLLNNVVFFSYERALKRLTVTLVPRLRRLLPH